MQEQNKQVEIATQEASGALQEVTSEILDGGLADMLESGYGVDIEPEAFARVADLIAAANPTIFGQLKKHNPELFESIKQRYSDGALVASANRTMQRAFHAGELTGGGEK
jgi:hypothetical protein